MYDEAVVLIVIAGAIALFISERLRTDVIGLLILIVLGVTGVLGPRELLAGFGNQAVITIAAMFVLSAALMRTGVVSALGNHMATLSKGSQWRFRLFSMVVVCILSAFINNTPVVVVFIPAVLTVCRQLGVSPSKFLMPISFASMLGGSCTLVGTSTNILVHSLCVEEAEKRIATIEASVADPVARQAAIEQFESLGIGGLSLFEFAWVGVPMALVGLTYLLLFSRRGLPERVTLAATAPLESMTSYVTEVEVGEESPLVGKPLSETVLAKAGVRVVEVIRGEEVRTLDRETLLEIGDVLLIRGELKDILALDKQDEISILSDLRGDQNSVKRVSMTLAELMIAPNSHVIGRTCKGVRLRSHYGVTAFAIQRRGRHIRDKIGNIQLQLGDVLLVRGALAAIEKLRDSEAFVLLEGVHEQVIWKSRAPIAVGTIAAVIALAAFNVLDISVLALAGVGVILLTRVVTPRHAYHAIDWSILVLIAGMISLGHAMQVSGTDQRLTRAMIALSGGMGPHAILFIFYAITILVTATVSTKASAVLLTPLAFSLAETMGVSAKPFIMAVAFASSTGFATPIGFQTNLLVLGPGGYMFKDFLKFGLPLCVLIWLVSCSLIPLVWNF